MRARTASFPSPLGSAPGREDSCRGDRTLTGRQDEPVALQEGWRVGIVHPLELDEAARQEWRAHLADYEIEPPFPQMERPAIAPAPEQAGMKLYAGVAGRTISALGFRGRAEKLGWRRASIGSGGYIPARECPSGPRRH